MFNVYCSRWQSLSVAISQVFATWGTSRSTSLPISLFFANVLTFFAESNWSIKLLNFSDLQLWRWRMKLSSLPESYSVIISAETSFHKLCTWEDCCNTVFFRRLNNYKQSIIGWNFLTLLFFFINELHNCEVKIVQQWITDG